MKLLKKFRWLSAIILVIIILIVTPNNTTSFEKILSENPTYPNVFPLTSEDIDWIESTIDSMTLEEKCAQLVMPPVYREQFVPGSAGYEKIDSLVKYYKVGGLILFQGDLKSEAELINIMQSVAEVPLLIASDYERGVGTRIDDAVEFPHAMALGATQQFEYAGMISSATSDESIKLGVNLNFAPVADINNNSENPVINIRSFSEREKYVSKFVNEFIKGSEDKRIILAVKHFPGHGNTSIDSHWELPRITGSESSLEANELLPFEEAIKSGIRAIMVGHLEVPAFDPIPGIPASLSKPIITFLLREHLGFDGLVVTDALNMEAITKYYSVDEAVYLSIKAGSDIVLMPVDPVAAINSLVDAVNSGKLTTERIEQSVRRILSAKRWLKLNENKLNNPEDLPYVEREKKHTDLANTIAVKSITLLKDDIDLIPLHPEKYKNIYCVNITDGDGSDRAKYFSKILQDRIGEINTVTLSKASKKNEYRSVLNEVRNADLILLPTFINIKAYQGPINLSVDQTDLIGQILKLKKPTILISFKNPYLISLFPEATTYLNSFSHTPASQHAMMQAILGETDISGTQPVSIPKTDYIFGSGLSISKTINTSVTKSERNVYSPTIEYSINRAISENIFPGASIVFGQDGVIKYQKNLGTIDFSENSNEMTENFLFDLHSLTQLLVIDLPIFQIVDEGKLTLDDPIAKYFNDVPPEKQNITIKNLLIHNSGSSTELNPADSISDKQKLLKAILNQPLDYPTGSKTVYSVLNVILLQEIIERVSGNKLDELTREKIFSPLEMLNTNFKGNNYFNQISNKSKLYSWSKTSNDSLKNLLNDISGFDGLNTTAFDLSKIAQMFLQNGYYDRFQIVSDKIFNDWLNEIKSITIGEFQVNLSKDNSGKITTLSFIDTRGNSLWIDMKHKSFLIVLTTSIMKNPPNQRFADFIASLNSKVFDELNNQIKK
jgi:beta-N-acetylhexosaminidase